MISNENMGEITQLAYKAIKDDLKILNNDLSPMDILDKLENGIQFKCTADLLKETMIFAGIPSETEQLIDDYDTISSYLKAINDKSINSPILNTADTPEKFINSLLSLLTKQEDECLHNKREKPWSKRTITRWFSHNPNGSSDSIRYREDAIAICFALGLDYPTSRDFLNKSGHAILNIRNHEDAVYLYCLINNRPLSIAQELINKFKIELTKQDNTNEEPIRHNGDTTLLLTNELLGNSNWETDDDFYNSFLLPNKPKFTSYSKTALNEYYKIKNPIYLLALKRLITEEEQNFNLRRIQAYIRKNVKDRDITISMSEVQVTYNFENKLKEYADSSELLKCANDMLDIHVNRIRPKKQGDDDYQEDDFKNFNNSLEVIDFIINNYPLYSNNDNELETISCFLTDTVTARRMLYTWLPMMFYDSDADNDSRQRSYRQSITSNEYIQEYIDNDGKIKKRIQKKDASTIDTSIPLRDTVLHNFPQRHFFTKYEKHPEKLIHNITLRKAIILLFFMNYTKNLVQYLSASYYNDEETTFEFEDFLEEMNTLLEKCQLGKLYYANPFDWLILKCITSFETHKKYDSINDPVTLLDEVLDFSFNRDDND